MPGVKKPFALSCGDPAGIGPEIICKTWRQRDSFDCSPFFVAGNSGDFDGLYDVPVIKISDPAEAKDAFDKALPILHIYDGEIARPGEPTLDGAQCALHSLEIASGLARSGDAGAVITAPVSKSQLYKVGFRYPGQTEFVSERCGIARENAVMMLGGPSLRVIPMTTHIPLKDVPGQLTHALIIARTKSAAKAMTRNFGIESPRIAIAGLNPHAGENGNLGDEEKLVMQPAIDELLEQGLDVMGPLPADTMFHAEARSHYDIALCPYHDQALIPLKTLHFFDGVNMTLGLPIVRTSPDHGTAFDIAGKNVADPRSMIAAIEMAATAVAHREIYDN
ncbi:4-hydroxythreonine-4-phosphate dehydrogenase PdxA [Parasphingorhabdus litoris]|uniref:4-hydroxythreonine-4-phosphate dehydrogenase n=1 Tax=Parasphingorhabdus litoris TaxID=394733 RepID=A0ABN1AAV2_9SPHN|nr:4-hydroxythreonine-4-phosphate dehydrogenase PdxA [Parasphingorhabdus litoris]